ncbi:MAG: PilZ domain-containing protein [Deltaproteobacteria bacterium]|nr:PilZ domain-containing protein [Deltaproteobacteria bacterium]
MIERRRAGRKLVDLEIRKHQNGSSYFCRACEISPTGIRINRILDSHITDDIIDIEVPLVLGGLTTSVPSRMVWREGSYEAFEFVDPSFAQQAMLERVFGNY